MYKHTGWIILEIISFESDYKNPFAKKEEGIFVFVVQVMCGTGKDRVVRVTQNYHFLSSPPTEILSPGLEAV